MGKNIIEGAHRPKLYKYIVRHTVTSSRQISLYDIKFNVPLLIARNFQLSALPKSIKQAPLTRISHLFIECSSLEEAKSIQILLDSSALYALRDFNDITK